MSSMGTAGRSEALKLCLEYLPLSKSLRSGTVPEAQTEMNSYRGRGDI